MQLDDIGVIEFFKTLDLSQSIAIFPGLVLAFHLFDGHNVVVGCNGFKNDSKGAITYGLDYLIFLHLFIIMINYPSTKYKFVSKITAFCIGHYNYR